MAHLHDVLDDDTHFSIDDETREITRTSEHEPILIQGDHNSERFTFDVPKFIDGHNTEFCNVVRIHFLNVVSGDSIESNPGIYEVDDLKVSLTDPSKMTFSWLISSEATVYVGTLHFLVEFMCTTDANTVDYSWHTKLHTAGIISEGMDNADVVIGENYDVLEHWLSRINAKGDEVTADVLNRINAATTQSKTSACNEIDAYAEKVKEDLTIHGLSRDSVLVQELGYSEKEVMSQKAVTEEFNDISAITSGLDGKITVCNTYLEELKQTLSQLSAVPVFTEIPLTTTIDLVGSNTLYGKIEIGKTYRVKSNVTTGSTGTWGFYIAADIYYSAIGSSSVGPLISPSSMPPVNDDAGCANTLQLLEATATTVILSINGEQHEIATSLSDGDELDGYFYVANAEVLEEINYASSSQTVAVNANGIATVSKTKTDVVDGLVTHTYTIYFDNGETRDFQVKDGIGITDVSITEYGDFEDTHTISFSNGTKYSFKVPNNNTMGIVTSDSGAIIHAEDLIPLEHTVKVLVRSKNLIPYPYPYSYGTVNGVTFTPNDDGSISAVGTVADGLFASVVVSTTLKLEAGKTYYVGDSPNLLFAYKDDAGTMRYLVNETILWKDTYEFVQLYIQYSPNVEVNETVYPMFCESDAAVDFVPYVDPSSVTLKRCGKNLLAPVAWSQVTESGLTFTKNDDGSITVNGTATALVVKTITDNFVFAAGVRYTLSGCPAGGGVDTYRLDNTDKIADDGAGGTTIYTADTIKPIRLRIASGATLDNVLFKPQLEVGDTATDYEKYVGDEYSIAASTSKPVSRVTSLTPTMNFLTNKVGAIIDATYNVDQTAAYNKINTLLETLLNGGA